MEDNLCRRGDRHVGHGVWVESYVYTIVLIQRFCAVVGQFDVEQILCALYRLTEQSATDVAITLYHLLYVLVVGRLCAPLAVATARLGVARPSVFVDNHHVVGLHEAVEVVGQLVVDIQRLCGERTDEQVFEFEWLLVDISRHLCDGRRSRVTNLYVDGHRLAVHDGLQRISDIVFEVVVEINLVGHERRVLVVVSGQRVEGGDLIEVHQHVVVVDIHTVESASQGHIRCGLQVLLQIDARAVEHGLCLFGGDGLAVLSDAVTLLLPYDGEVVRTVDLMVAHQSYALRVIVYDVEVDTIVLILATHIDLLHIDIIA